MEILGLKLGGIGCHYDAIELPITQLDGAPLVAIVGENGAGKTTALECIPGALYRSTPSRGLLSALANRKDSFVDLLVKLGEQTYNARVIIDGVAKTAKVEAYLFDGDGKPLTSGKVRDYVAEIAKRFPSQDVYLASAFAAQSGEGRFLDLAPAERKALFTRLLGLGRLEELSKAAGERARGLETDIAGHRAAAGALEEQAAGHAEIASQLGCAATAHRDATSHRETAEKASEAAHVARELWRTEHARLDKEATRTSAAGGAIMEKENHAATRFRETENRLSGVLGKRARLAEQTRHRTELDALVATASKSARRIAESELNLQFAREAQETHAKADAEWQRGQARVDIAIKEVDHAKAAAAGLDDVPCAGEGRFSSCPLINASMLAKERAPGLEMALQAALADHAEPPSAPLGDVTFLEAELAKLRKLQAIGADAGVRLEAIADAESRTAELDAEAADLRVKLAEAQAAHSAAVEDRKSASAVASAAHNALAKLRTTKPKVPDSAHLDRLRTQEQAAIAEVARLGEALKAADAAGEKLAEITAAMGDAVTDLDDWRHLQKALGRDGIQALEIDVAGPEVSGLTNDLLHACYGPRFTVSLETTKLKADGKGSKEVFELRVIDTKEGIEGSADNLSPGEKVLVSEALSLAIAIYHTRRSSIPMLDLFRDECCGALSANNAIRYIEMLRKALDIGGFSRCYFVAHQPQLWDLADKIIEFKDGTCRLGGCST